MGLFDGRRAETPEWQNPDPRIRRAAVARLEDVSLLSQIARDDTDEEVRRQALAALEGLALADDQAIALSAVEMLSEEPCLIAVVRQAPREDVARAALAKLRSPKALAGVARQGLHLGLRLDAVASLADPEELGHVALKAEEKEVALAALERIAALREEEGFHETSVLEIIGSVAERARNKAASRRARALLRGGEGPVPVPEAKQPTDRLRQRELCESMEALARTDELDGLMRRIDGVRGDWIDLIPDVDLDFEQRFDAAWRAAKEHLVRRGREEAERTEREAEAARVHAERVAPRLDLIQRVESLKEIDAEQALAEIRQDWDRVRFLDTEEGEALQRRFEKACGACEQRLEIARVEHEMRRLSEEKGATLREKAKREKENLGRLEHLCARAERIAAAEQVTLKATGRALKELRKALEAPGPFPASQKRAAWVARLRTLQSKLTPRVTELRQSESWRQWANEGVQEELCRRAEGLAQTDDPAEAGRQLTDLQTRWRQASIVSHEKSQELWQRFKAARDAVRARMQERQDQQAARKESLFRQAEALAPSTDWISTADALKRLQTEWKTIGSVGRSQDRLLWERFRGACDAFFTRRKGDLKQRKEDWANNLHARVALCHQVEALSESTDWEATAGLLKRLQADWKAVGPVGRRDSEATWKRFRVACDRFFERYKRRHEIERAERVAQREKICAKIEVLIPAGPSPAPEGLLAKLQTLQKEWAAGAAIPQQAAQALEARFQQALDAVVAAFPDALKGSELDAEQNRLKMEELLARVEKLMPERNSLDPSGLSPATRLAAMWVEAMAANTIGGSVGNEAQWRAAQEEVHRAQAAWQKIGHLPRAVRGNLTERFQRACNRVLQDSAGRLSSPPGAGPERTR